MSTNIIHINVSCHKCGIIFGLPEKYYNARYDDGGTFYCPNGHPLAFLETAKVKPKPSGENIIEFKGKK